MKSKDLVYKAIEVYNRQVSKIPIQTWERLKEKVEEIITLLKRACYAIQCGSDNVD